MQEIINLSKKVLLFILIIINGIDHSSVKKKKKSSIDHSIFLIKGIDHSFFSLYVGGACFRSFALRKNSNRNILLFHITLLC